jgi:hypothetical protein
MTDFPDDVRGSTRLLEAWETRTRHVVSDSDIKQIAARLEESSGELAHVVISGGEQPTGFGIAINYDGDEPQCGNDLQWLIDLLRKLGGGGWQPPVVIKNGQPAFERLTVLASLGVLPANAWDAVIPQYRLGARELLGRQ